MQGTVVFLFRAEKEKLKGCKMEGGKNLLRMKEQTAIKTKVACAMLLQFKDKNSWVDREGGKKDLDHTY